MTSLTLADAFNSFRVDALRLESLPLYTIPEEHAALAAQRSGAVPNMSFLDEWLVHLREAIGSGRRHRRVRLVSDPLTDYERFETSFGYSLTARAGEEIRTMNRADAPSVPADCWVFDGDLVFEMEYDEIGKFNGARRLDHSAARERVSLIEDYWSKAEPWQRRQ